MKAVVVILILSLAWAGDCYGAIVNTSLGTIDKLFVYDDFGATTETEGADVIAWFDTRLTQCPEGVWLSPSQPGYSLISASLLAAYMGKSTVRFQVYDDKVWTGSSASKLCKIDALRFE